MSTQLPVYVVLVNYNRGADTIECLESVLRSDYAALKVIVVDNCSENDSVERMRRWASGEDPYVAPAGAPASIRQLTWPPIRKPIEHRVVAASDANTSELPRLLIVKNSSNAGFAEANNCAMRLLLSANLSGYVCLINNDMVVAPDAIREMVATVECGSRIGAVGGVMLEYMDPDRVQMVGGAKRSSFVRTTPFGAGLSRTAVPADYDLEYVSGGLLLAPLQTLRDVGLLDVAFFLYAEDLDWGIRMLNAGYRLAYSNAAYVWHKGSITIGPKSPFQDHHVVLAQLTFVRKHSTWLVPAAFVYSVARSLLPKVIRGEGDRARAVLTAYAEFLGARRSQRALKPTGKS
jgi:GT2 family glycosyltransferase